MLEQISLIPAVFSSLGLKDVVISPGSRNAPLTIGFNRHPDINCTVISDERSAGFIGLGMAQASEKPVALACTSGTAALNYTPSIAEAFYQKIPLIILTADRPPERIGQQDGQTIDQQNIYRNFIKKFYQFPVSLDKNEDRWYAERIISEAWNIAVSGQGPVHINIPFREPFYPSEKNIDFQVPFKIFPLVKGDMGIPPDEVEYLNGELKNFEKIIMVPGQQFPGERLLKSADAWCRKYSVPLITDSISNFSGVSSRIRYHDLILRENADILHPDLIISFGGQLISKNLKTFLRTSQAAHWHIDPTGTAADVFQRLSLVIQAAPEQFFEKVSPRPGNVNFLQKWLQADNDVKNYIEQYFKSTSHFSEAEAVYLFSEQVPDNSFIHVSNSMPVRYFNYCPVNYRTNIRIFSNRGTSGIDGVVSTAVGTALKTDKPVFLLTGDMAFFYDRNAFWNEVPPNLRVIILNNHGGIIFKMIKGPDQQEESEKFFKTNQPLTAENLANEFGIGYLNVKDRGTYKDGLTWLTDPAPGARILELENEAEPNVAAFQQFINYNRS